MCIVTTHNGCQCISCLWNMQIIKHDCCCWMLHAMRKTHLITFIGVWLHISNVISTPYYPFYMQDGAQSTLNVRIWASNKVFCSYVGKYALCMVRFILYILHVNSGEIVVRPDSREIPVVLYQKDWVIYQIRRQTSSFRLDNFATSLWKCPVGPNARHHKPA